MSWFSYGGYYTPAFSFLLASEETCPQTAWRAVAMMTDTVRDRDTLSLKYGLEWLRADYAAAVQGLPPQLGRKCTQAEELLRQLAEILPQVESFHVRFKKDAGVGKKH